MVIETTAAIESLKAAITVVRGMKSLNDRAEINSAVIDIQAALLDTQQEMFTLQETIRQLKERIAELERFDSEKFELAEIAHDGHRWSGRKAYRQKSTGIYYCPGCFAEAKLTPIQFKGSRVTVCRTCNTRLGSADDHEDISMTAI